jgi:hypothetical protein
MRVERVTFKNNLKGIFNDSCVVWVAGALTEWMHSKFGWQRIEKTSTKETTPLVFTDNAGF